MRGFTSICDTILLHSRTPYDRNSQEKAQANFLKNAVNAKFAGSPFHAIQRIGIEHERWIVPSGTMMSVERDGPLRSAGEGGRGASMSEVNKALVRRWVDAFNE